MKPLEPFAHTWPPGLDEGSCIVQNVEGADGIHQLRIQFGNNTYWLGDGPLDLRFSEGENTESLRLYRKQQPPSEIKSEVSPVPTPDGVQTSSEDWWLEYRGDLHLPDDHRKVFYSARLCPIPREYICYINFVVAEQTTHTVESSKAIAEAAALRAATRRETLQAFAALLLVLLVIAGGIYLLLSVK